MSGNIFTLACRETRMGAYTTMHGEKYDISKTGCHWRERTEVEVGDVIEVLDITNSGKCRCCAVLITSVDPLKYLITDIEKYPRCPVCGG